MRVFSYLANHFFKQLCLNQYPFTAPLYIHSQTHKKLKFLFFSNFIFDYLVIFLLLLSLSLNLFNLMTLKY